MVEDNKSEFVLPVKVELSSEKQVFKEFIFQLEELPELWDSSLEDYSDKIKRLAAHKKLLQILKKIKPTATVDDVRKKINSLRSNYRKELKRVADSTRSDIDEVYKPKSWTFKAMQFLQKNEKPVNVEAVSDYNEFEEYAIGQSAEEFEESSISSHKPTLLPRKKTKVGSIAKQNESIEKECLALSETPESSASNINVTAIYWSEKLEKLKPHQRIYAEKAINDILFEAELGTLNRNSIQMNQHTTSRVTSSPETNDTHSMRYEGFEQVSSDSNILPSRSSPEYVYVPQHKKQRGSQSVYYKQARCVYASRQKSKPRLTY